LILTKNILDFIWFINGLIYTLILIICIEIKKGAIINFLKKNKLSMSMSNQSLMSDFAEHRRWSDIYFDTPENESLLVFGKKESNMYNSYIPGSPDNYAGTSNNYIDNSI
jgi:hypothetical protein